MATVSRVLHLFLQGLLDMMGTTHQITFSAGGSCQLAVHWQNTF